SRVDRICGEPCHNLMTACRVLQQHLSKVTQLTLQAASCLADLHPHMVEAVSSFSSARTVFLPSCPKGSVLTKSYTPPAGCCPSMPPQCTCDFRACNKTHCPSGQHAVLISQASGRPGDCCDVFECQKGNSTEVHTTHFDCSPSQKQLHSCLYSLRTYSPVSPNCVFNGKKFSEGEVYRMDPCWLCQCRGGISFCSKAECGELDCEKFYIPEGECCPVCIGTHTQASCWVNNKLRTHEEQWKEDDCTFCQCVDGDPHCTAMACKQSCQNPVKIPGECCPFCEEPSYETVSPLLCPPLENCSLSGNECPYGFQQDHNGCLLCQYDSCPDLGKYCPLQCPTGYEKDDLGCEVCECSILTPKCRTLTCTKTCPYGYVNKHGCEMCRCVKCPPFTCDKYCSNGYRQNRKGCNICTCKEIDQVPSTTVPASMPSFCLTSNGRRYEEGDSWHDGCRDCYCLSGREMCVLISCPMPSCSQPVVKSETSPCLNFMNMSCCNNYNIRQDNELSLAAKSKIKPCQLCFHQASCTKVLHMSIFIVNNHPLLYESGSGQPEGMDMVVCRAPGGELYVEGETWNLNECMRCTCRKGRVLCDIEVCPPALCQTPVRNKDTCCHMCPATCYHCTCNNGTIQCFSQHCPAASCRVPVLLKGQCCPHCLGTFLGGCREKHRQEKAAFCSGKLSLVETVFRLVDQPRLGENYPSHTEMALVYQSAAWILAGLLLAIIIFLIVALLINKKKKWVQMSCYSAPKKVSDYPQIDSLLT
uniref:VWFC domain-containing protein n=1 Tax=Poecilia reticulata TaxID=8081 RepID=A0A3P9Q8I2_POERE